MNVWEWITSSTTVDNLLTTLGIGTLAFLFARDLILTKGQHLRRVQDLLDAHQLRMTDLLAHQERERLEKDQRIADIRASRDKWEEAARVERERADRVTDGIGGITEALTDVLHVLTSLNRALPTPPGGEHERAR